MYAVSYNFYYYYYYYYYYYWLTFLWGRRGHVRMVVGFTTTYAFSAYHHWWCEFKSRSGRGAQHYETKFVSDLRQFGGLAEIKLSKNYNLCKYVDSYQYVDVFLKRLIFNCLNNININVKIMVISRRVYRVLKGGKISIYMPVFLTNQKLF